jgi:3-oxoadipate enol-lactonase
VPAPQLVSSIEGPPDAPVLVLGNPIGTTRDVWSHQVPVLSRYFRVVRYEPRGHGAPGAQSPAEEGPYTIAELGADVLLTLGGYGIERFAFAGVSLGGMTGIWLAANVPERVTSLAVCCAALTPVPDAKSWHDRAALARTSGMAALAGLVVPRWFTPRFLAAEPEQVETVVAMLKGTSPVGYAGCAEAIAALDLRPALPNVQAPALVLSGAEDVAAPPSVGAYTARNIPGARLTVIQAASHFAHYEKPGPVTDALLTHFRSLSNGRVYRVADKRLSRRARRSRRRTRRT